MVSGAFISYAVISFGAEDFRLKLVNTPESKTKLGKWWEIIIRYIVPVEVITLLIWWMYLSATEYAPDTWYNPFDPYSVATVIGQWFIALGLVWFFNRKLIPAKTNNPEST